LSEQQPYSFFFEACLALAFVLPLISFAVSLSIPEKFSRLATVPAPLLMLISALCAFYIFVVAWSGQPYAVQWTWFTAGDSSFSVGIYLSDLSVLMLVVVTLVSFLVHLYSTGYMSDAVGLRRYFAMLGFFTFSMLGIVLADNLLLMFVFWELVGFSSYALIGHWYEREAAAAAAKKAFVFNRIGDIGFLIGLMMVWTHTGTFDILQLASQSPGTSWQTAASICIFCGVIGKSAQFPLFTWLPDAMEGPTPVSALIHAATMVAAGVFLLTRMDFLFSSQALDVVAIVGILTALIAGLSALFQTDLKKILAYSTISQLGLMVTAFGASAADAAMLHLFTHAFFKACLFLSSGLVIHAMHEAQHQAGVHNDVQDIRNLGGLRIKMPFTFWMVVISGGALAGLPFSSGFLSKDAILTALMTWSTEGSSWRWMILIAAFLVSFITVLYTFRLIWFVFLGDEKSTRDLLVAEPPWIMRIPTGLLCMGSLWFLISWSPVNFSGWLFNSLHRGEIFHAGFMSLVSGLWVLIALVVAYFIFRRGDLNRSAFLLNSFYLDGLYQSLIGRPALQLAVFTDRVDRKWIDGLIHLSVYIQVTVAHGIGWFDRIIVDGIVDGLAHAARGVGSLTRSFQRGKIQLYIFWAALAIIIFLIWTLI
jgi:NADH-quinone oxidoreductase subunit L